jgi:L-methionine (R)-S-oxide reductase
MLHLPIQLKNSLSDNIFISENSTKQQKYEELMPQLKHLLLPSDDLIANLANCSAALKTVFNFWWVGFYLVKNNQLVLGPFQGPIACTKIQFGKGVCGASWQQESTIIVKNVNEFPGHIACSSASLSEIVVPIILNNEVVAVMDVDSEYLAHFDEIDKKYLEELSVYLAELFIKKAD